MIKSSLNSIPLILRSLIFLGTLGFLFSSTPEISEETFLFCLKSDVEPLQISRQGDSFSVNNRELNNYFEKNGVLNIEKWIPQATEMDRDGDIYLNRIYRVYIDNDRSNLTSLISDIENFYFVKYAENEFIRRPNYQPNDSMVNLQCSLNSVKATSAWDFWDIPNGQLPDGREVLLASVDTGVDYTHPDLQDNSWINQAEIPEWMAEAGLDSDNDGFIEASEVVLWMTSEGMDVNGD